MKLRIPRLPLQAIGWMATISVVSLAVVFHQIWIPTTESWVQETIRHFRGNAAAIDAADGEEAPAGLANSLEVSQQARLNIGLTDDKLGEVRMQTFRRSITVPAMVVERPGRTLIQVATPMTGVITHVHAVTGEAVASGTLLFQIRLTHEDLVKAQTDFLKTIGELDVERREVKRLTESTATGAVAKIKLIERQYAEEKLEALSQAQQEALRLHGLSNSQVQQIVTERRLLRELKIFAPFPDQHAHEHLRLSQQPIERTSFQADQNAKQQADQNADKPKPRLNIPLIVSELNVHKGQAVSEGETLCVLSDMRWLYIEGQAFEQDTAFLEKATKKQSSLTAIQPTRRSEPHVIENLKVAYLDNRVNVETRALKFFVGLANTIIRETWSPDGQRFVAWQYKPGQRMQLRIPVEEWPDRIVVPVDAVAQEGAEYFVFMENGKHFDRKAVHVEYRDQFNVVIANDGSLFAGDVIALTGAHQMQMAIKNKSGGAIDPHAGHTH